MGFSLKKLVKSVAKSVVDPFRMRDAAKAVGLKGVADAYGKLSGKAGAMSDGLVDQATGKASKMKKEAEAANIRSQQAQALAGQQAEKSRADAADKLIEDKRMAGDSASRTLLTGGQGLEDDEDESVSRKTLRGF